MHLDLDQLDRDGALQESAAGVPRGDAQGLPVEQPPPAEGLLSLLSRSPNRERRRRRPTSTSSTTVPTLEYLQAAFYTEAERRGALRTPLANETTRVLGAVGNGHTCARCAMPSARLPSQSLSSTSEESRRTRMPSSSRPSFPPPPGRRRTRARRTGSTPRAAGRGDLDPLGGSAACRLDLGTSPARPRLPPVRLEPEFSMPEVRKSWPRPASSRRS